MTFVYVSFVISPCGYRKKTIKCVETLTLNSKKFVDNDKERVTPSPVQTRKKDVHERA